MPAILALILEMLGSTAAFMGTEALIGKAAPTIAKTAMKLIPGLMAKPLAKSALGFAGHAAALGGSQYATNEILSRLIPRDTGTTGGREWTAEDWMVLQHQLQPGQAANMQTTSDLSRDAMLREALRKMGIDLNQQSMQAIY